jgi:serine/threonine protein kinase/formylglycine-generating enzyme required for sulfatase activity
VLVKGTSVGRYLVLERLGAGAMGVVYAAYDPELDRKIALKLLRAQEGRGGDRTRGQERLVREAKAIAKLSHPNVVGIFDVGVHEGHVFMAMEYLGGGTLREWMSAKKRSWREIVKMFIEVGRGLAAAHAEGLIHRDFKPDNVLVDKAGKPKVADFGLVRLRSGSDEAMSDTDDRPVTAEETPALPIAETALAQLTRTGAIAGTPAYMAPEQFLGGSIAAHTDQFAFCVALYEALYGERPFAGETVMSLGGAVTSGRVREAPPNAPVPPWVRRVILTGLRAGASDRHSSVDVLVARLLDDPDVRRRKRLIGVGTALAVGAVLLGTRFWYGRRQHELDRRVSEKVHFAEAQLAKLSPLAAKFDERRRKVLHLFDAGKPRAEVEWKQVLSAWAEIDAIAQSAFVALDTARALRPSAEIDAQLTRALIAHAGRSERADHFDAAAAMLARLPQPALADSLVTGSVTISTNSYPTRVVISRYERSATGNLSPTLITTLSIDGPTVRSLVHGSYLLRFSAPSKAAVSYPLLLRIGEAVTLSVPLPAEGAVPAGFSYVPAGRFLKGDADEKLRTGFTNAVPLHDRLTAGFLIGKHEVTFADWIAFLRALPRSQVAALLPRTSETVFQHLTASVDLRPVSDRTWRLKLTPVDTTYVALEGEDIVYPGRDGRARQNWLRMPVIGVSGKDLQQYAAWLDRTGRLPGARLCDEEQWERAARGADDRRFPHGNALAPTDANHDVTYGRVPTAFGPDEVGSHPASRSPFDVDDMAGNVWEIAASPTNRDAFALRSGSYYHFENSELVTNREPATASTRSAHVGGRICAELPKEIEPTQFRVQPD